MHILLPVWKRFLPGGIRARLFILITLALLPLMLLIGLIFYQRYEAQRIQALQTEVEVARGIAATFGTYVEGVQQQNHAVGQAILAADLNDAETLRLLTVTASHFPAVRNMSWTDVSGKVLASSQPGLAGRDLSGRPYFQQILAGSPWAIGDLTSSGIITNAPTLAVATAIVDNSGALRGVVVAGIEPTRLGSLIFTQQHPSGDYSIFDRQGVVVFTSSRTPLTWEQRVRWRDSDAVLQRVRQTGQEQAGVTHLPMLGGDWVAARVPVPGLGFFAGARRPVEVVLEPLQRSLWRDALAALLVGILAFLLAAFLAQSIAGPIYRLEQDAQAMGEGQIAPRRDPQAPTEVSRLRGTVEEMAAALINRAAALRESERVRQEANERFRVLFYNRHSPMLLIEPGTGMIVDANPAACSFYGWSQEELAAMNIKDINTLPEDQVEQEINRARAAGTSEPFYFRHHLASGEIRDVEVHSGPIQWAGKSYLFSIINDITDRRRAEEELRGAHERVAWLARLPEENPNPVARISAGGLVLYHNAASAELPGWNLVMGQPLPESLLALVRQAVAQGQAVEQDVQFDKKVYSVSVMPFSGEHYANLYGRDVSERKSAEEALRRSEERLTDFLESTHDSFFALDFEWRIVYANRRYCEIVGRKAEDIIGKNYWAEFFRYAGTIVEQNFRKVMQERVPLHYQSGGFYSQSWYDVSVYPNLDGISVFSTDRTEAHQAAEALRQSESRLRRLVEANLIGVVTRDADGKLKDANEAFLKMVGYNCDDVQAGLLHTRNLVPEEYLPVERQIVEEVLRSGTSQPYEKEYIRKDGQRVPILIGYTRLEDSLEEFIGFVLDLTELKKAQAAMTEFAEKLQRSNKELEEFAFIASHDLQEPLRKIRMFGDSLQRQLTGEDVDGKLPPEARDYLNRMLNATDRMQAMINGLLDLSRVSMRPVTFQPVNLSEVAAEVTSDLEARIAATGGRVEFHELPSVEADALQMRQLFQNLVGNALKFHRPDVPPVISITGSLIRSPGQSQAVIRIADNGIGFEEEYAGRIFQPFQRLVGRNEYEGTGLGLSICQKIVERHRGKIAVRSVLGEGTVFTITLPVKQAG